jgi:uncharacterized repeat protein (TIGR04052 family)
MHRSRFSLPVGALAGALALAACASDSTAPSGPQAVAIRFTPRVGAQAFTCGQSYTGLGSTSTTATATDFMMYVSSVELLRADGSAEPVELVQDGRWQIDDIALLDFATNTNCPNATADTNYVVRGTVPAGNYTGLRFVLGVPFARNHADVASAPSPLNLSRMFWSWNAGYKFVRLDLTTTGVPTGWNLHLGSTTCTPGGGPTVQPTTCAQQNRPTVTLNGFNAASNVVIADVASLLASTNLDVSAMPAAGCMSGPTDTDCVQVFQALGLPFGGSAAPATQNFFRVGTN